MTDFEHEHAPVDPSDFGRQVRERWDAHNRALMESTAEVQQHAQTSQQLRRAHRGLYDDATPQQRAAEVSDRPATVGADYGGRPLEKLGGLYDHHVSSPHPASRDLRNAGQPGGLAYDPLASLRQSRGQQ